MSKYSKPKQSNVRKGTSKPTPNLFELEQTMQMALMKIETLSRQVNDLSVTSGKTHRDLGLTDDSVTEMGRGLHAFQKQMDQRWEAQGLINRNGNELLARLQEAVKNMEISQRASSDRELLRWEKVTGMLSKLDATLRDNTAALQEASRSALECTICLDKPRNTVVLPCSHFATCGECLAACRSCPVCRGAVNGSIKVFMVYSGWQRRSCIIAL